MTANEDSNRPSQSDSADTSTTDSGNSDGAEAPAAVARLLDLVSSRKIDASIFVMRVAVVFCALLYMVPTFTPSAIAHSRVLYERAILAAAAAGALRMHQLTAEPSFRISEALSGLCLRDDTHFFLYALLFMYNTRRMTIIILPLMLYHLLESLPYYREVLRTLGISGRSTAHAILRRVDEYRSAILQLVAWLEIVLILVLFLQCLYGGVTLFQLLIYYRYLVLRYSAFNPHCRMAFLSLHTAMEVVREWPDCPEEVRSALDRVVSFVRWLKPTGVDEGLAEGSGDTHFQQQHQQHQQHQHQHHQHPPHHPQHQHVPLISFQMR